MDFRRAQAWIDDAWVGSAQPSIFEYIKIPALSPAFDECWEDNGHLEGAARHLAAWAIAQLADMPGARVEIVRLPGRTPSIFIDAPGETGVSVLCYGHLDKQPPMSGWQTGKSAWSPVIENGRLYGRGGADDGYSIYAAILALKAVRRQGLPHPAWQILIEGSEESGSPDLEATLRLLSERIGAPDLVIVLDANCGNYGQMWRTTSLRGQVAGVLAVRTLDEGVHSGDASGVAPGCFQIVRALLEWVEDARTGLIRDPEFAAEIPRQRRIEAQRAAEIIGALHDSLPMHAQCQPIAPDPEEQLLNRSWRPRLAITGIDGLPAVADAAAVHYPALTLKLSLRLPPTVDAQSAGRRLKTLLEHDPPYGAGVTFTPTMLSNGWSAPELSDAMADLFEEASLAAFSRPVAAFGGGGGIPFLNMLGREFPDAQFLVTGVLGPRSNAHGPNEFLHLEMARRLTGALSFICANMESIE